MQIRFTSVMAEDQDTALRFYTSILGFEKMMDGVSFAGHIRTPVSALPYEGA